MPHSAVGRPALSKELCCQERKGTCSPSVARAPKPAALGPSETQGSALLAHPEPGSLVCSMGGGAGALEWGSAGLPLGPSLPVHRLVPWAQDPASHRKTASQQELPSFQYGSFFFPFSSTSARALSLSFSLPSSPSLPIPPHPKCSLCSAGPGYGLAVSGPSRGVFPTVRQALVSRALCARWLVFTCARARVP